MRRPVVVAAREQACRSMESAVDEDMEQRLEEVANEEENRRPEVGAAKDADAWRPVEVADEAEMWTPEEAAAKAQGRGGHPAKSAERREVAAETDGSCGAEVAAGAEARVLGRPTSGSAPHARAATSAVVAHVCRCRAAPFAVAARPLLPRPPLPRCHCARLRRALFAAVALPFSAGRCHHPHAPGQSQSPARSLGQRRRRAATAAPFFIAAAALSVAARSPPPTLRHARPGAAIARTPRARSQRPASGPGQRR